MANLATEGKTLGESVINTFPACIEPAYARMHLNLPTIILVATLFIVALHYPLRMPLELTPELVIVSFFALLALIMSSCSAYVLVRYVRPIAKKSEAVLDSYNPAGMTELKNEVMSDLENMAGGYAQAFSQSLLTWKEDMLDQAQTMLQDTVNAGGKMIASIFQHEGATLLGKEGREKSLANAQIKKAKQELMKKALEAKLGPATDVILQLAEERGIGMEQLEGYLKLAQSFGIDPLQFIQGGGQTSGRPMQHPSTTLNPPPHSPTRSGYKPLGGR